MILDFGNMLVNLWRVLVREHHIQEWTKLAFSLIVSGLIAFLGTDGLMLIAGRAWLVSLGYGMAAAASSMMAVILRSPQGRGLLLSFPQSVVKQYQDSAQTTIAPKENK